VQVPGAQALDELFGLHGRHGLERRHDHERRAHVAQEAVHGFGPGDEPVPHGLEENEEASQVLQELAAQDAVRDLVAAFQAGKIPDSMNDIRYYNIKTMQALNMA